MPGFSVGLPQLQLGGPAPVPPRAALGTRSPSQSGQEAIDATNALKQQQGSTDISTNATKELNAQQAGLQSAAAVQASQLGMQQHEGEAKLQADAEQRRLAQFPQLLQTFNSSFKSGGMAEPGHVDYGGAIQGEDAANSAAYGRAKDVAGQQGRAALDALHDVMGARGLTGSGISMNRAGGVIGAANSNLADVNREQLIQSLAQNRARASEQFQGNIAQRGQDVSLRGQNISAQQSFINPMLGLITARY